MSKIQLSMLVALCSAMREGKINSLHFDYARQLENMARSKLA